jgi:hypothetical protein
MRQMKLSKLALLLAGALLPAPTFAGLPSHMDPDSSQIDAVTEIPKWVDLRAVWENVTGPRNAYVARILSLFQNPNARHRYLAPGIKFDYQGVGIRTRPGQSQHIARRRTPGECDQSTALCYNQVYGVEVSGDSQVLDDQIRVPITVFFHSDRVNRSLPIYSRFVFRKFIIIFDRETRPSIQAVARNGRDISLHRTSFRIRAGILDRLVILEDRRHGIRKIFPIAVGAINRLSPSGRYSSLTPIFEAAHVNKRVARRGHLRERCDPHYFRCRPFIPITRDGATNRTSIGFHIHQTTNRFPGAGLQRGFFSHGCMRMLERDLYEMYAIVRGQRLRNVDVRVTSRVRGDYQHPYPLIENRFGEVVNGGTHSRPRAARDSNDLVVTRMAYERIPYSQMVGRRRTLDESERFRPRRRRRSTLRAQPRLSRSRRSTTTRSSRSRSARAKSKPARPTPSRSVGRRSTRVATSRSVTRPPVRRRTPLRRRAVPERPPEHNVLGLGTAAPEVN